MTSPSQAPRIHPAHPTLTPGDVIAFEAIALRGEVEWELLEPPQDGTLRLVCTSGVKTLLHVPSLPAENQIYFLRASNRDKPELAAVTSFRIHGGTKVERPLREGSFQQRSLQASGPVPRRLGLLGGLKGLLGVA